MNVLDRLEPRHPRIVDVMGLIIEDGQFVNIADDRAQVDLRVRSSTSGALAEEIVHRVFIVGGGRNIVARVDAVNVRQKMLPVVCVTRTSFCTCSVN